MPTARRRKHERAKALSGKRPVVNLLAIIFGSALERLRVRMAGEPISSREMAKALGLAYGSYRLTETGDFPLRISRSLSLARKLHLTWDRVARVLAAIQVLEEANQSVDEMRRVTTELAMRDEEIGPFLAWSDALSRLVDGNGRAPDIASLEEIRILADAMAGYLAGGSLSPNNESGFGPPAEWTELIRGIPPFYLEALAPIRTLIDYFRTMPPPQIDAKRLGEFEQRNTSRLWREYAILRDPAILDFVNREQPQFSSWPYLLKPQFEFLGIVIAAQKASHEGAVLRRFRQGIKRNWARSNPEVGEEEAERVLRRKLRLRMLKRGQTLGDFLWYDAGRGRRAPTGMAGGVALNNIWLYCLRSPANAVALVDNFQPNSRAPLFAATCSWEFTEELASELTDFWKTELTSERQ